MRPSESWAALEALAASHAVPSLAYFGHVSSARAAGGRGGENRQIAALDGSRRIDMMGGFPLRGTLLEAWPQADSSER